VEFRDQGKDEVDVSDITERLDRLALSGHGTVWCNDASRAMKEASFELQQLRARVHRLEGVVAEARPSDAKILEVLGARTVQADGLFNGGWYISFTNGEAEVTLDATFTAEDLECIAAHMRAHGPATEEKSVAVVS
jgi:hypothetical protein